MVTYDLHVVRHHVVKVTGEDLLLYLINWISRFKKSLLLAHWL